MTTFTGTSGNDTINGTAGSDFFNMNDGGNDTVNGGGGNDVFTFGGALTSADKIQGSAGYDAVILNGNYAGGVTFSSTTMVNVEEIDLFNGNSYKLTVNAATLASGQSMLISAAGLGSGNTVNFDCSAQTTGVYTVNTGAGADVFRLIDFANTVNSGDGNDTFTIVGSAGHNTINAGAGADTINYGSAFNFIDRIDGGTGLDTLVLNGNYSSSVDFQNTTLLNVENIQLTAGNNYNLRTVDATVAAGQSLFVDGHTLASGQTFSFLGNAETNGSFHLEGGAGNDSLAAGTGNDILNGNAGNDAISMGTAGSDIVNGGAGDDNIGAAAGLSLGDIIDGGTGLNTLQLGGATTLTLAANTIQNIQIISISGGGTNLNLTFNDGNIAAGHDLEFTDHFMSAGDIVTLDDSAETDGSLFVKFSGAETLNIKGGAQGDEIGLNSNLSFTAADKFDGGGGNNGMELQGDFSAGVTLNASTMKNFQNMSVIGDNSYKLTFNDGNVAAGQVLALSDGGSMSAARTLTLDFSAETDGKATILVAGVEQLVLHGGAQGDAFNLHNSAFASSDKIDGGGGSDVVSFEGDYAGGLTLGTTTIVNVEQFTFNAGHNYNITTNNATVAAGQTLTVSAAALLSGNSLVFNGGAETDGVFKITGGSGNDFLTGGGGDDSISAGPGTDTVFGGGGNDQFLFASGAFTVADKIDGGSGTDDVYLSGNFPSLVFNATTINNVEGVHLSGINFNLTTNDANVAAGATLGVTASSISGSLVFDGSAETDGSLNVVGGAANDVLVTGAGADFIGTNEGTDTVHAGAGNDRIASSFGFDATDSLDGGAGSDTLELLGDYGAGVTLGAGTLTSIETILLDNAHSYALTSNDGNVAAGTTLTVDGSALLAPGSAMTFDGSAETDGTFILKGGANNDTLTGGAGKDTFTLTKGGNDVVSGGAGNDTFYFGATFSAADSVDGGAAGGDTVRLDGDYSAGIVFSASTMVNVETIMLATGNSYAFTSNDATVATGQKLTVDGSLLAAGQSLNFNGAAESDNGQFILIGGDGDDTLKGGNGVDKFTGGLGADSLKGAVGADTFLYGGVNESTGSAYDTLVLTNLGLDKIDLDVAVAGTDTAITTGFLSAATFNANLAADVNAANLLSGHAVLFTADAGTLSGHTYLVVDANGAAGYQADEDYVFDVTGNLGGLTTATFI